MDTDKVRELFELQKEFDAINAEKAFNEAMTLCQGATPSVIKADSRNLQTNSNYAKYDAVVKALKPIYTEHGFTVSFGEELCDREGFILVVATVRHSQGHAETFKRFAPIDNVGPKGTPTKTLLHGCESSMKYMQRKLLESIFGVSEGEDDDGNAAGQSRRISGEKAAELEGLMADYANIDTNGPRRLLGFAEVERVEDLQESQVGMFEKALRGKLREAK